MTLLLFFASRCKNFNNSCQRFCNFKAVITQNEVMSTYYEKCYHVMLQLDFSTPLTLPHPKFKKKNWLIIANLGVPIKNQVQDKSFRGDAESTKLVTTTSGVNSCVSNH